MLERKYISMGNGKMTELTWYGVVRWSRNWPGDGEMQRQWKGGWMAQKPADMKIKNNLQSEWNMEKEKFVIENK